MLPVSPVMKNESMEPVCALRWLSQWLMGPYVEDEVSVTIFVIGEGPRCNLIKSFELLSQAQVLLVGLSEYFSIAPIPS